MLWVAELMRLLALRIICHHNETSAKWNALMSRCHEYHYCFNEWLVIAYWESVTLMLSSFYKCLMGATKERYLGCMAWQCLSFKICLFHLWTKTMYDGSSVWVLSCLPSWLGLIDFRQWLELGYDLLGPIIIEVSTGVGVGCNQYRCHLLWEVIAVSWIASLNLSIMATWACWMYDQSDVCFGFVTSDWL